MAEPQRRPGFLESWLDDIRDDIGRYGSRKVVPWTALACALIGFATTSYVPKEHFWDKPEISVVFFTAAVTINGLLLALSWGSFAKIYEIASEPRLAKFLRRHRQLNGFIFHVDFIHYTQVSALSMSGLSLILCVVENLPERLTSVITLLTMQKISMGLSVATSIYALRYALGAVRMMQDLVWYSAELPAGSDHDLTLHSGGGVNDQGKVG